MLPDISAGTAAAITALQDSVIYIQKTENSLAFAPVYHTPEEIQIQEAGTHGGCMRRRIKTIFDLDNAPYSNMVLGEVLNYPGLWSSYPPHHHPQPEVYFFQFVKPQGVGAGFANGSIYQTRHNSLLVIKEGFHSQCAAPGYAMCYVWGIRHLPGNLWEKTRFDDAEHAWLLKAD